MANLKQVVDIYTTVRPAKHSDRFVHKCILRLQDGTAISSVAFDSAKIAYKRAMSNFRYSTMQPWDLTPHAGTHKSNN